MSAPPLPFKVLGQISPILAWVEGDHGNRLPSTWSTGSVPFRARERGWLLHELPNYSYDNVQEIVEGSRAGHHDDRFGKPTASARRREWPSLSPDPEYNLLQAFRRLNEFFFTWNGTEPCIRKNRIEELHELAIRMPAGHIVRHGHANAVSEGVLKFREAVEMPELVTLLPSNSFGLRGVVRKGLSESHLHMNGVISAEETWADSLLWPVAARSVRGSSPEEGRLLVLNLFAGRLLALAIWYSLIEPEHGLLIRPQRLLCYLDGVYFARTYYEMHYSILALENEIRYAVHGPRIHDPRFQGSRLDEGQESPRGTRLVDYIHTVPEDYRFLLRWMAPTAFRLKAMDRGVSLPGGVPETAEERHRFVHQLHLAAHLWLIQLSVRKSEDRDTATGRGRSEKLSPDPRRHFLHETLFRYLVCRTHHWQLATQQGRTTGLRHFKEFYDSRRRWLSGTELQRAELVFQRLRQWRGLRVLEGRVSPPRRPQDLTPWILAYARPRDRRIQKFGMVVHFIKEDEATEEKGFSKRIPKPVPRLRWGRRRRLIRYQGMRLYRLLKRPTPVTPFIVGIDAANLELSTPPEVFAPVFRFLREFPIPLADSGRRFAPYLNLERPIRELVESRRLGMTYHVGEDFRHLLSGLRAINEVIEFLGPNPGDRLGHGTALALQPRDWMEHNGYQAVMPKLEWLDTLVWVHHFLGSGDSAVGDLDIEDRIQRRSWEIYSEATRKDYDPFGLDGSRGEGAKRRERGLLDWDWSPLTLWDAWLLRQLDPYSIDFRRLFEGELKMSPLLDFGDEERRWRHVQERVADSIRGKIGSRNAYLLLALYWLSPKVREEGDKIIVVDMRDERDKWLELCHRVEEKMKALVHERELVVEVNPSVNRIVGPMERYNQHHVFHLTLDEDGRLDRRVRVSVNTDNPAVCNTTLAHEYYLLGEILIKKGLPEAEVVRWLDWLRANGEDYSFVRRLKAPQEDFYMEQVLDWLRGIRTTVREARTRERKYDAFKRWLDETRLRDQGFSPKAVAADEGALRRIVALEHRLRALRRLSAEPDLDSRLREIERELRKLQDETKAAVLGIRMDP